MQRVLRSLNREIKGTKNSPLHFLFFDTETVFWNEKVKIGQKNYEVTKHRLDFGFSCLYDHTTGAEIWGEFRGVKKFHQIVENAIEYSKGKILFIVAHNIVFDIHITDLWRYFEEEGYETVFLHAKGMSFIHVLRKRDKKGKTIKKVALVNNGNLFPAKLETIGKCVGLEKLEMDWNNIANVDRAKFLKYGRRDVEILVAFWKKWLAFISDYKLGGVKFTVSSQSLEAFRVRFLSHWIVIPDDELKTFERQSYFGGRTEIFHVGKVRKKIWYYDINSMYPFVMKNERYPNEFRYEKDRPQIEYVMHKIEEMKTCVVAECWINTEKNVFPMRSKQGLLFPVGRFKTTLCTPEVVKAVEMGVLESFEKVAFYSSEYLFKDFVDFMYNERLKAKDEKNPIEVMIKLIMNALYGKFAQMGDKWHPITEEEVQELDPNFTVEKFIMEDYKLPVMLFEGQNITPQLRYIAGNLQISGEKEEGKNAFPAISAHVTSYARLVLYQAFEWAERVGAKVYYCDTDSIFCDREMEGEHVHPSELGKFKLETVYENGVNFINLKNYCPLNWKGNMEVQSEDGEVIEIEDGKFYKSDSKLIKGKAWKMKGVSDRAVLLSDSDFITQEWGGLPKQEYYKKFGRKGGEFWVVTKLKHNKGNVRKGVKEKDGNVKPIRF